LKKLVIFVLIIFIFSYLIFQYTFLFLIPKTYPESLNEDKAKKYYDFYENSFNSQELEFENLNPSKTLIPKNAFAIIIGISDYPGTENDLEYCDDDSRAIYSMLINDYNFKSENIIYLQDSDGSLDKISNAFNEIAKKIKKDDIFFFYYSGHGGFGIREGPYNNIIQTPHPYPNYYDKTWFISHPGADYMRVHFYRLDIEYNYDFLLCGDSDVNSGYYYELFTGNYGYDFWSSYIPVDKYYLRFISDEIYTYYGFKVDKYEAITDKGTHYLCSYDSIPNAQENYLLDTLLDSKLDQFNCSEKYILLDSCNSGGMIPEVQEIGRYIITACKADESSLESPSLKHGIFTYYFLRGNQYATDINGDGVKSMEEIFSYVYSNTVSTSSSEGYTHHPQVYDGIKGESILQTSFSSISINISGNKFDYSFYLYGTGLIQELKLIIYNISNGIFYKIIDLTETPCSNTGFGFYNGSIKLNNVSGLSGYGIFSQIFGNKIIKLSHLNSGDTDMDTLNDALEILNGLNPLCNDTDKDGLDDAYEYFGITNPLLYDTDNDELSDGMEVLTYKTDPTNPDTDGDGANDGEEIKWGSDPLDFHITPETVFLNYLGIGMIIAILIYGSFIAIKNIKQSKMTKEFSKDSLLSIRNNIYNSLKIEKIKRPIQKQLDSSIITEKLSLKSNEIKDLILNRLPPPNSSNSIKGKKALIIAVEALNNIKFGDFQKGMDLMILSLLIGVPEPFNKEFRMFLLNSLKKLQYQTDHMKNPDNLKFFKRCPSCGKPYKDSDKFCGNCGNKLKE